MMLIARHANAGVSTARNTAIARARGELIFILDADNVVYPTTIQKLSAALKRAPDASFAYGIISNSDGMGLVSYLPWDVARLCQCNYIDAMALIRRSVLDEVGGYDLNFGLIGWEDYELWLRLAASDSRAEFVPEFVGVYGIHSGSRQETVALDTPSLMLNLRGRYPFLPWEQG
jgi:GT2 family glycosyltransferase